MHWEKKPTPIVAAPKAFWRKAAECSASGTAESGKVKPCELCTKSGFTPAYKSWRTKKEEKGENLLYIFDMGGVFTTTASVLGQIEEILGISKQDFLRFCGCKTDSVLYGNANYEEPYDKNATDLFSLCSDGFIGTKEFWRIFSERSGIVVKTDWWQWLFHPKVNEKTVALVKKLREGGGRVVCGTNTIDAHYRNHCERGDYANFDQTYASCLMGVSKPNPDFWKIILTAEGVEAKDAVFIDDKKINCEAARSLGIKSIQFESAEQVAQALQVAL